MRCASVDVDVECVMYVGKSYLFFWVWIGCILNRVRGEKKGERRKKMRREGKEEFLKRCRVRPRLGYRRWGGRELSLSLSSSPETKRSFCFLPDCLAIWLSIWQSICLLNSRLVSQQAGTAQILYRTAGLVPARYLYLGLCLTVLLGLCA